MSAPLGMDTQQIATASAKLAALVQERTQREQRVTEIATQFAQSLVGESGQAMQQVLTAYLAAAEALRVEEAAIAQKLALAGEAYDASDAGAAGQLSSDMGI